MKRPRLLSGHCALPILCCCLPLLSGRFVSSSRLDLSYQHHLGASNIALLLERSLRQQQEDEEVEVDVSNSFLGDEGVVQVMQVVVKNDDSSSRRRRFHVAARMNRLTPAGAIKILEAMMQGDGKSADIIEASNVTLSHDSFAGNVTSLEMENGNATVSAEDNDNSTTKAETSPVTPSSPQTRIDSLDLGLNAIGRGKSIKSFLGVLRQLIEDDCCPTVLRLDRCGLGPSACRAIGKGLLNRFNTCDGSSQRSPLKLYFGGNDLIGDGGVAALAAALRKAKGTPVVEVLDLSSCSVGDTGAEALAMAIRDRPGCVKHLDVRDNDISKDGAISLGNALEKSVKASEAVPSLELLDLSHNEGLGDRGAAAIAAAVGCGAIRSAVLRSCALRADSASSFGECLKTLAESSNVDDCRIDLSGNPLGILRPKKKGGTKYSASLLKSKASATTASYMNFIGKKLSSGLKDVGFDVSPYVGSADGESDDDEEEATLDADSEFPDASQARCGAKSFAAAFLNDKPKNSQESGGEMKFRCELGMRHCHLDNGGADALAAAIVEARKHVGLDLTIDVSMNPVLEKRTVRALAGSTSERSHLEEMAHRHMDALEALRVARQRAAEAARTAASRSEAETAMSAAWYRREEEEEEEYAAEFGEHEHDSDDEYEGEDEYDEVDEYASF